MMVFKFELIKFLFSQNFFFLYKKKIDGGAGDRWHLWLKKKKKDFTSFAPPNSETLFLRPPSLMVLTSAKREPPEGSRLGREGGDERHFLFYLLVR